MKPWVTRARALTPEGAELLLQQRGEEHCLRAGGHVLMSSRATGSEAALAHATCARLGARPTVLIGGLGLGFTLRAALDRLPAGARVTVAELLPEVVAWNRDLVGALAAHPLADARVEVVVGDVRGTWRERQGLDVILLDVDNGPMALSRPDNAGLYGLSGLREAFAALKDRGVLGVWSAGPAPVFLARLREAGFAAERRSMPRTRHELLLGWKGRPRPTSRRPARRS